VKGQQVVLDLWCVEENRALGRLGTYPAGETRSPGTLPEGIQVSFSPSGRWLLVTGARPPELEIWKLPELERVGRLPLPAPDFRSVFDDAEQFLLLARNSGPSRRAPAELKPFAFVVQLGSATKLVDLQEPDVVGGSTTFKLLP